MARSVKCHLRRKYLKKVQENPSAKLVRTQIIFGPMTLSVVILPRFNVTCDALSCYMEILKIEI
jgi:hypothetical protein